MRRDSDAFKVVSIKGRRKDGEGAPDVAGAAALPAGAADGLDRAQSLCHLLIALTSASDEAERIRLLARGLPSLLPCTVSGAARRLAGEDRWHVEVTASGAPLALPPPAALYRALDDLASRVDAKGDLPSDSAPRGGPTGGIPPCLKEAGVAHMAVAPIRTHWNDFGLLVAGRPEGEAFAPRELLLLRTLGEHTGAQLEMLRLQSSLETASRRLQELVIDRTRQLQTSQERMRMLLEVNNAIISSLEREELFAAITPALSRAVRFDEAGFTLYDPSTDSMTVATRSGTEAGLLAVGTSVPRIGSHLEAVIGARLPALREDLALGPVTAEEKLLFESGLRSYISAPMLARDKVVGAIVVASRTPGAYTAEQADFLLEVGKQVGLAVSNMLAYEEIGRLERRLEGENVYLKEEIQSLRGRGLVLASHQMRTVVAQIEQVAPTVVTVLVHGESGTGKELVAHEIHRQSRRRERAMISVNCAAIPRELFESEFFGHVKGAFTGATRDRTGRFQLADGGTLFLDEVAELPMEMQAKLLRVIQEGRFERVGEEVTRSVDVRIVAATNRDLEKEVEAGRFRVDLFYRLNVFPIRLAPLRERVEDIGILAEHFLAISARELNVREPRLTEGNRRQLASYAWPGNVRELQNVIERALITARGGVLDFEFLLAAAPAFSGPPPAPRKGVGGAPPDPLPEAEIRRLERENMKAALEACHGKVYGPGGAAERLGVPATTLVSRLRKLGLHPARRSHGPAPHESS